MCRIPTEREHRDRAPNRSEIVQDTRYDFKIILHEYRSSGCVWIDRLKIARPSQAHTGKQHLHVQTGASPPNTALPATIMHHGDEGQLYFID